MAATTATAPTDHIKAKENKDDIAVEHVDTFDKVDKGVRLDKFGSAAKTNPAEIALVKKLDLFIMPILWLMYFLNFLDRNAIVSAKLNHLNKDLGLKGSQYNTCVSVLFVGYILGQIPSNMILSRVRPSWYMAGCMLAWAIVSTLTCVVKDFKGMVICRFMLGITEAPFYSGAVYMVSLFYNRKESATRLAIFYTGNLLASSFSGLLAAAVFAGLDGKHGLEGWRWLFLIQGVITVGVAILSLFLLPDSPLETRWLTAAERQLAHTRIERDTTQKRLGTSTWKGFFECVTDYRCWIFAFMGNMHLSANGFKNFMPTVVKTLGFNTTVTLVLTCPPFLLATFTSVAVSWSSGHFNERTWHITISKAIACVGFILGTAQSNVGARYFAMVLFVGATYGVNNIILSWTAAVVGQTDEKKAVAIGLVNTLGNLSFIYTPYLWPDRDAPNFSMAMYASTGFSIVVVILAWVMKTILKRVNEKLKASDDEETNFYVY